MRRSKNAIGNMRKSHGHARSGDNLRIKDAKRQTARAAAKASARVFPSKKARFLFSKNAIVPWSEHLLIALRTRGEVAQVKMKSSVRWAFGFCVTASLIMVAVALHLWGAAEVRANAGDVFFLTFVGTVWLLLA